MARAPRDNSKALILGAGVLAVIFAISVFAVSNPSLVSRIGCTLRESTKNGCFIDLASRNKDPYWCQYVDENTELTTYCDIRRDRYLANPPGAKLPCETTITAGQKDLCYFIVASSLRNPVVCQNMLDQAARATCSVSVSKPN